MSLVPISARLLISSLSKLDEPGTTFTGNICGSVDALEGADSVVFFVINQKELSLSLARSLRSFNECLETHQRVIRAPLRSRHALEQDAQTTSYSEAN
jgi:hypothetical protein